jgi:glycosyltransferase involved in cell wall biosynthesis
VFISVIICTHNPRPDHLQRTLQALTVQTLPETAWELLLIDNRSERPLTKEVFPKAFSPGRIVREGTLGLTAARLCGMREARGELLVFVDDDNELAPDYLERAAELARRHPTVGVFSASIRGEYESPTPRGFEYFEPYLAIRELQTDVIGTQSLPNVMPIGAGMVVRREVAQAYARNAPADAARMGLERKGNSLLAGGDSDLGFTALDLGLACGGFAQLRVTHLIGTRRLEPAYLERLVEDVTYSHLVLARIWGTPRAPFLRRLKHRLALWLLRFHPNRPYRQYRCALQRAKLRAARIP